MSTAPCEPRMRQRPYQQVDVFSAVPLRGNPLAVVLDGEGLSEAQMQAFAAWTQLSETTFVLPPTPEGRAQGADYRVRIFTPGGELPFAGHPTLGSCAAWLAAGGQPRSAGLVVQECGVGLVPIRRESARLAFAAPPLRRTGPLEPNLLGRIVAGLGLAAADILDHQWVDNGPGWCAVLLGSVEQVRALRPDFGALRDLKLGVVAPCELDEDTTFEVRAFVPGLGINEDPVTGSLNAGIAQWLMDAGLAPYHYVASQGSALGRDGRVHVDRQGGDIWVGGDVVVCIEGEVTL